MVEAFAFGEFAYNNNYQASIGISPFEAMYGKSCRSLVCWVQVSEPIFVVPEMIQETQEVVMQIQERMRTAYDRQRNYADQRWCEIHFAVGDHVLLKDSPTKENMRFCTQGNSAHNALAHLMF